MKKPRDIVRNAIIKLLMDDPFWACVIMRMKIIMTETLVQTLGTDGKVIVINSKWVQTHPFMELVAALVHEACHVALKHNFRRGNRNFLIWNYATDYAINQNIRQKADRNGHLIGYEIPSSWLYDPRFDGMHAEPIYDILMSEVQKQGGGGPGGEQCPTIFDPNGSGVSRPDGQDIIFDFPVYGETERRQAEEIFDVNLHGIYAMHKAKGKAPAFLKMDIESRHVHKIDYRELLREWLTKNVFTQDYCWLTCDRRFVGTGFHIPALVDGHDGQPSILFVCDVSGSMLNQRDLPMVADEIQGVLNEFPGKYFILYTDTGFKGVQEVDMSQPLVLKFEGGGGTDFRAIMDYVKEDREHDFDAVLFFTDMETLNFGRDPEKPVLWMNTNPNHHAYRKPSFGRIVNIE